MSSSPPGGPDRSETEKRIRKHRREPLSHPAIFSRECFDYEQEVPKHLREIYHTVFRAWSDAPKHADAPRNIARFLPREHGKSEGGTVVTPVWAALSDPNVRILIMSETETQAKGKLRECRTHLNRLADYFGRDIVEDNKTEITLGRQKTWDVPTIKAAGYNSGITGGHFDILIFDDIISWQSQRTEDRREKKWAQFRDYLNLGSKRESVFLVLGTRKHPDDLYSNLINGPGWDTVVKPAMADFSIVENKAYDVVTDEGNTYPATDLASINTNKETIVTAEPHYDVPVLWEERWDLESLLLDIISGFGSDNGTLIWQREMMNDATALQGQILSEDMLHFVDEIPGHPRELVWSAGLDPAIEDDPEKAASNDTDYWSLAVIAHSREQDTTYLVDVARKRGMTMAKGLNWVRSYLRRYNEIHRVMVEDVQAQRWFVQTGKDEGLPLERSKSTGTKEDRIISASPRFESGKVKIVHDGDPMSSSKWQSFMSEWAAFPTGDHDDRLDAVEIALRNVGTVPNAIPSTW